LLLTGVILASLAVAGPAPPREPAPCFEAAAWPEADRLFRRDPHWVGADAAGSIPLGDGRTCWLFGDSWIDPSGRHDRRSGRMVRNTVAVQHGADPSQARIVFAWRSGARGTPASFFPEEKDAWYWPGHGIRLGDRVVVFLMRVTASRTGLGFLHAGWGAFEITRPDDEPSRWRVRRLRTPRNTLGVAVGSAAVLLHGGHVYAFSSREPVTPHPMHLVRWRAEDVARGELTRLEWWGGAQHGWLPDGSPLPPEPVFTDGQSELSVHLDETRSRFVSFQTIGFGAADIAVRDAAELTGPWSDPHVFHRPAEHARANIMLYAARAHPELRGADLVLTYATNSFRFEDQLADSLLYYPRFLRLRRCRDRG
jgi:hypothetical protein